MDIIVKRSSLQSVYFMIRLNEDWHSKAGVLSFSQQRKCSSLKFLHASINVVIDDYDAFSHAASY